MLVENELFGARDKVKIATERIRAFQPADGYYLCFSGGKDSIVIKALASEAGVKYDAHYNMTTVDPPDVVWYIREHHPDVICEMPAVPFLRLLRTKGFPMARGAWCCEYMKEKAGDGRTIMTGVRWAESARRKNNRKMVEFCNQGKGKKTINPIIDWTDDEVWEYIRTRHLPYCRLYDKGWKRIGCLGCPKVNYTQKRWEFDQWPKYENAFRLAFRKLYQNRKRAGKTSVERWRDGDEMFDFYMRLRS